MTRRALVGAATGCALLRWPQAVAAAASATPAAPARTVALATLLEGEAVLLRGNGRFALAEGVALLPEDIVTLPAAAGLTRLEFADGVTLALGPGAQVLLAPRLGGERAGACAYLLSGWAKLGAPPAVAASLLAPAVDAVATGGTLVLWVRPEASELFAESDAIALRPAGAPPRPLKAGEAFELSAARRPGAPAPTRPTPAFLAAMPRAFRDVMPARAARFREHEVAPRRQGDLVHADARPWLDAEPALRRANLPRWRPLARDPDFRRALAADLKSHPEWAPVLAPPPLKSPP